MGKEEGGEHPSTRPRYARHVGVRRRHFGGARGGGGWEVCGYAEHHNRGGDISQLPVVTPGFTVSREQEAPAAARDKSNSCVESPENERRASTAALHALAQHGQFKSPQHNIMKVKR